MQQRLAEAGFDTKNPLIVRTLAITFRLAGKLRRLSRYVGGFVIAEQSLSTVVSGEDAAMYAPDA